MHSEDNLELLWEEMRIDSEGGNGILPVADRVSVAHDVLCEEIGMNADEAVGVLRTAHVIDIGFACAIESCEIGPAEGVYDPGALVFWVRL